MIDLHLKVKRLKVKPLQQTWASKCLLLRDQAKLFAKDVPLGPIFALQHPISSSTPSIFAGKACSYSEKSDKNNSTISIVYEPDVRWLLVRTGEPSAEHWQEERDWKLKVRSFSTSLFPGAAVTPPVLLPPEFILSFQPRVVDLPSLSSHSPLHTWNPAFSDCP